MIYGIDMNMTDHNNNNEEMEIKWKWFLRSFIMFAFSFNESALCGFTSFHEDAIRYIRCDHLWKNPADS